MSGAETAKLPAPKRRVLTGLAAALVSALLALVLGFRLEVLIEDAALVLLTPPVSPPDEIVLVAIDEDTLSHLPYRSPIDRAFLARMIRHIDAAAPRAIGVDILLDQPSEPDKDAALLSALGSAKSPIVMGYATGDDGLTAKQAKFLDQALKGLDKGLVTLSRDDFDGTVRTLYPGREVAGSFMPGLAAALAKIGGKTAPAGGRIRFYHDAAGHPLSFKTYPAHSAALLPADWFRDRYVLIGSALPTSDRHPTPFVTILGAELGTPDGMAIHAHMLTQMLRGERILAPPPWAAAAIVLGMALIAALILSLPLAPLTGAAVLAGLIGAYLAGAYFLFSGRLVMLPAAMPVLAALLTAVLLAMGRWYRDRAERLFIEKAFSQYVSPAVVQRISRREHELSLGGEARIVTYVFTDLEGFTSLSESLAPDRIAALLNDYLDAVCGLYVEAEATIDKIVGDAVIGFFGAPEQQDDQACRAVELALAIDRFSEAHRRDLAAQGTRFGVTRIGVHKGKAIIGNFGGSRFFDYTGIGDTVNVAARLEAANRHLGTRICVSGSVAGDCPELKFRPVGDIVLKGKQVPIPAFEPLQMGALPPELEDGYASAYALMAGGDAGAGARFAELAEAFPDDALTGLHNGRLQGGETGPIITLKGK